MVTFLDLPREIRDIIYDLALVSPTGQIIPKIQKSVVSTRLTTSNPKFKYASNSRSNLTLTLHPCNPTTSIERSHFVQLDTLPLANLLPAAHPQIHNETVNVLWEKNTLVFKSPSTAIKVLKHMGQVPSRLIRRVHLHVLPSETSDRHLGKALSMLASRGRSGNLCELRLLVRREARQICKCGKKGVGCLQLCKFHMFLEIETWMRTLEKTLVQSTNVGWGDVQRWVEMQGPVALTDRGTFLAHIWRASVVPDTNEESMKAEN